MDETSLSGSAFSTSRMDGALPTKYEHRIQHLESENYALNAQITQLIGLKATDNVERIKELCLTNNKQAQEIERLHKTIEECETAKRRLKRQKDQELQDLNQKLIQLRDENATLRQTNKELEEAANDDESRVYRALLKDRDQGDRRDDRPALGQREHPDPRPIAVKTRGEHYMAFASEVASTDPKPCMLDEIQSVCSESAADSRIQISVDAELSIAGAAPLRDILNRTNAAQSNLQNYRKMLNTWRSNMHILYEQLRQTANFLGQLSMSLGARPDQMEQIEAVLAKINGMHLTLNTSLDQTTELVNGASGMEASLAELSGIIDDSLRRSISMPQPNSSALHREMNLTKSAVDAQNELARVLDEKRVLEDRLHDLEAEVEQMAGEVQTEKARFEQRIKDKEASFKASVDILESSLIRNRDEVADGQRQLADFAQLRADLEQVQNDLHDERSKNNHLLEENGRTARLLNENAEELEKVLAEYEQFREEFAEKEQLVAQLQHNAADLDQLKQQLNQAIAQKQAAETVKHDLIRDLTELRDQLERAQCSIQQAHAAQQQHDRAERLQQALDHISAKIPAEFECQGEKNLDTLVGKVKGFVEKAKKDADELVRVNETLKQGNQLLRQKLELGARRHGLQLADEESPTRVQTLSVESSDEFFKYFDSLAFMAKVLVKKVKSVEQELDLPLPLQVLEDARQLRAALLSGLDFFRQNRENVRFGLAPMNRDIARQLGHIHRILTVVKQSHQRRADPKAH